MYRRYIRERIIDLLKSTIKKYGKPLHILMTDHGSQIYKCSAVKFIIIFFEYCLPSRDRQPNTIVFLFDPVTVTIGLLSAEIYLFLLTT
jgi:hypothetical protein